MARKVRLCFEGALYHVTSRGDNKEKIFSNISDRKKLLFLIKKAKEKFCFKLYAYVLMRNHFHLLIETSQKGTISQIMHYINGNYTKYFNLEHKRSGHLFQGRFHSNLIERSDYLLEAGRYVHLNPVRAKLVQFPEDYKWSSYLLYIGKTNNLLVDKELFLTIISTDPSLQNKLYKDFIHDGLNKDFNEFRKELYKGKSKSDSSIEKKIDTKSF